MSLPASLRPAALVTSPPPGSVNVRVGRAVEGPGGRWVPCASAVADGTFVPGLFEVGRGRHQVSASCWPTFCPDEALSKAFRLALIAAA